MKAAVAGSTGFIGSILLDLLNNDQTFDSIQVLSRKDLKLNQKFNVIVGDLDKARMEATEVAFCALGTTMATAGSKDAFYHVDHDLVVDFAKKAMASGAKVFVLVSSVGADANSSNYYLKVKGETERDVEAMGFDSLVILRPSMLMGERREFRFGELVGKGMMSLFNPLMKGSLSKYRGIQGKTVASVMVRMAKERIKGTHILQGEELFTLGK